MMLRPVAHYLEDFCKVETEVEVAAPVEEASAVPVNPLGYLSPEEVARKVAEACARTRAECETTAEAVLTAALEEQKHLFDEQLATARRDWTEAQGDHLASRLVSEIEVAQTRLAAVAARVLRPFLAEEVRKQAVKDMAAAIGRTLADPERPPIAISGPADLLDALSRALEGTSASLSFHPDASGEVRAVAGDTILETQLQEWMSRLDQLHGSAQ